MYFYDTMKMGVFVDITVVTLKYQQILKSGKIGS